MSLEHLLLSWYPSPAHAPVDVMNENSLGGYSRNFVVARNVASALRETPDALRCMASEPVCVTAMCCGTEAGSYWRLIDSCIAQLNFKAQGPSRTCNESKEEECRERRGVR